jgi:hypothetical protein
MSDDQQKQGEKPCPEGMIHRDGECVMPDVTFEAFLVSLNTTALFHLGELADPDSGEKKVDLMLVRHTIDTLQLLQEKTRGNVSEDEANLLETMLHDLRLRFVMAKK